VRNQGIREGQHDLLVLLNDRESFLIAMLNEVRATCRSAADVPRNCIRAEYVARHEPWWRIAEEDHLVTVWAPSTVAMTSCTSWTMMP